MTFVNCSSWKYRESTFHPIFAGFSQKILVIILRQYERKSFWILKFQRKWFSAKVKSKFFRNMLEYFSRINGSYVTLPISKS